MFCRECGNKLIPDSKFCDKCGVKVEIVAGFTPIPVTPEPVAELTVSESEPSTFVKVCPNCKKPNTITKEQIGSKSVKCVNCVDFIFVEDIPAPAAPEKSGGEALLDPVPEKIVEKIVEKVVYVPQKRPWWTTWLMVLWAFVQFSVGCGVSTFFISLVLSWVGLDGIAIWLIANITTISIVVGAFKALTVGLAVANMPME